MSDVKISALPVSAGLDGTEIVPIVDGGVTQRTTIGDITALSATLSNYLDFVVADTPTTVPADGFPHGVSLFTSSPTSWYSAGSIITPGLYLAVTQISQNTPATTPGLYLHVSGNFNVAMVSPVDALGTLGSIDIIDPQSIGPADLPYAVGNAIRVENDATCIVNCLITVYRLAF